VGEKRARAASLSDFKLTRFLLEIVKHIERVEEALKELYKAWDRNYVVNEHEHMK
jgi:hypothetical protein